MKFTSHIKSVMKIFKGIKLNTEETFDPKNIHIFIESNDVKQREDKKYCLIGYFEEDEILFSDLLSDKSARTHNLYNMTIDARSFEYVTLTGASEIIDEYTIKYAIKFNGSYLDGETVNIIYDLKGIDEGKVTQETTCEYPAIIEFLTKTENSQKLTMSDITKFAKEINNLVEKKLEKEQQQESSQNQK